LRSSFILPPRSHGTFTPRITYRTLPVPGIPHPASHTLHGYVTVYNVLLRLRSRHSGERFTTFYWRFNSLRRSALGCTRKRARPHYGPFRYRLPPRFHLAHLRSLRRSGRDTCSSVLRYCCRYHAFTGTYHRSLSLRLYLPYTHLLHLFTRVVTFIYHTFTFPHCTFTLPHVTFSHFITWMIAFYSTPRLLILDLLDIGLLPTSDISSVCSTLLLCTLLVNALCCCDFYPRCSSVHTPLQRQHYPIFLIRFHHSLCLVNSRYHIVVTLHQHYTQGLVGCPTQPRLRTDIPVVLPRTAFTPFAHSRRIGLSPTTCLLLRTCHLCRATALFAAARYPAAYLVGHSRAFAQLRPSCRRTACLAAHCVHCALTAQPLPPRPLPTYSSRAACRARAPATTACQLPASLPSCHPLPAALLPACLVLLYSIPFTGLLCRPLGSLHQLPSSAFSYAVLRAAI